MSITADYQAELGGVTIGAGTVYPLTGPIGGLGVPRPRTYDTPRGSAAGDAAGPDVADKRVITLPVAILGDDPADCWDLVDTLCAAWAPSPTDVSLDIALPGGTVIRYTGRPRGVTLNLAYLARSTAEALLTFEALDPDAEPVGS